MKKAVSAALLALCMLALSTAAYADAALPPNYQLRQTLENVIAPIVIAVVIIVIGIVVKVLKNKHKK